MKNKRIQLIFSMICIMVFLSAVIASAEENQIIEHYMMWNPHENCEEKEMIELHCGSITNLEVIVDDPKNYEILVAKDKELQYRTSFEKRSDEYKYYFVNYQDEDTENPKAWQAKVVDSLNASEEKLVVHLHPFWSGMNVSYAYDDKQEKKTPGEKDVVVDIVDGQYVLSVDLEQEYRLTQDDVELELLKDGRYAVNDPTKDVVITQYDGVVETLTGIDQPQNWDLESELIHTDMGQLELKINSPKADYQTDALEWKYKVISNNGTDSEAYPLEASTDLNCEIPIELPTPEEYLYGGLWESEVDAIEISLYNGETSIGEVQRIERNEFSPAIQMEDIQLSESEKGKGCIIGNIHVIQGKNNIEFSKLSVFVDGEEWSVLTYPDGEDNSFYASGEISPEKDADIEIRVSTKNETIIGDKKENVKINRNPEIQLDRVQVITTSSGVKAKGEFHFRNVEDVSIKDMHLYIRIGDEEQKWKETEFAATENDANVYNFEADGTITDKDESFVFTIHYSGTEPEIVSNSKTEKVKTYSFKVVEDPTTEWKGNSLYIHGKICVGELPIDQPQMIIEDEAVDCLFSADGAAVEGKLKAEQVYEFSCNYELKDKDVKKLEMSLCSAEAGRKERSFEVPEKIDYPLHVRIQGAVDQEYDAQAHELSILMRVEEDKEWKSVSVGNNGEFIIVLPDGTEANGTVSYTDGYSSDKSLGLPQAARDVCDVSYRIYVEAEGCSEQYPDKGDCAVVRMHIDPMKAHFAVESEDVRKTYNGKLQTFEAEEFNIEVDYTLPDGINDDLKNQIEDEAERIKEQIIDVYNQEKIEQQDATKEKTWEKTIQITKDDSNIVSDDITVSLKYSMEKLEKCISTGDNTKYVFCYDGKPHKIGKQAFQRIETELNGYGDGYYSGVISNTDELEQQQTEVGIYPPVQLNCTKLNEKAKNYSFELRPMRMVIVRQSLSSSDPKISDIEDVDAINIDEDTYYDGMQIALQEESIVYDGKMHRPKPIFSKNGETIDGLIENVDYLVRYYADKEFTEPLSDEVFESVGEWYIEIIGIGNYGGVCRLTEPFRIVQMYGLNAEVKVESWEYDGKKANGKEHPILVKCASDAEYSPCYLDSKGEICDAPVDAGKYTVIVTWSATKNCAEVKARTTFEIKAKSITDDDASVQMQSDTVIYSGKECRPEINVMCGTTKLRENVDYSIDYKGDTCVVGDVEAVVNGIGNYTGTVVKQYRIIAKDDEAFVAIDGWVYDGEAAGSDAHPITKESKNGIEPQISYLRDGKPIDQAIDAGIYTLVAEWKKTDFYTAVQRTAKFCIQPREIRIEAKDAGKTFGEDDPKLKATVYIGENEINVVGEDTVELVKDNCRFALERAQGENVGDYAISCSYDQAENDNYRFIFESANFTINPRVITDEDIVVPESATFDGQKHLPSVAVKRGDAVNRLEPDADYYLESADGDYITPGDKTVRIVGIGNYAGEVFAHYSIQKDVNGVRLELEAEELRVPTAAKHVPMSGRIRLQVPIENADQVSLMADGTEMEDMGEVAVAGDGREWNFKGDVPIRGSASEIMLSACVDYGSAGHFESNTLQVKLVHTISKTVIISIAAAVIALAGLIVCLRIRKKTVKELGLEYYRRLDQQSMRSSRTIHQDENE